MNAAGGFITFVGELVARSKGRTPTTVALLADRIQSSTKLFTTVAMDLEGVRAKIDEDRLTDPVKGMLSDEDTRRAMENLFVAAAEFDQASSPEKEIAVQRLRSRLVDPSKAEEAWAILFTDAVKLCAEGSRRDEADLVSELAKHEIRLRESTPDEAWRTELESIRVRLLDRQYPGIALDELERVIRELDAGRPSPSTRAEAMRLLAHALHVLKRTKDGRAAALRATELDPSSPDTHATYSRLLLADEELVLAADEAEAAVAIDPNGRRAWLAKLHVANETGLDTERFPAGLLDDPVFRADLASIRIDQERWRDAIDLTEPLLADPEPTPYVRYFHAVALANLSGNDPDRAAELRRAETEMTTLIISLRLDHPVLVAAYFGRSIIRNGLGETAKAATDEDEVRKLNRDNPQIVEQTVAARLMRGDVDGALALLETSSVPASPVLLAMRAGIRLLKGRREEAVRDLDAAAAAIATAEDPDAVAYKLGDVAIDLGDLSRAESYFDLMTTSTRSKPVGRLLAGRIAFARGNVDQGRELFRAAIGDETSPERIRLLRLGLAFQLHAAKLANEALAVFNEVGFDGIADNELQPFIITAFEAGDLVAAKRGIDRLGANGPLPRWALSVRADIGLRSDDPESVVNDILAMEQQGAESARIHLTMASSLIELGKNAEALPRVRSALAGSVTPRERMEAGIYLKHLGQDVDALDQFFLAYRYDRNDPQIQRTFASMVMTGGVDLAPPETVVPGCHVSLIRTGDGLKRGHSIYEARPLDKATGDLLVTEATEYLGKRTGEQIVRDHRPLPDEVWTIEAIARAEVHAAQTIVATYEDNFPNEPFFVMSIHIGDLDTPRDFTGIMAMLGDRRQRVAKTIELYHQNGPPLQWLAKRLQASIPEVIDGARNADLAPLIAEWGNPGLYAASAEAAATVPTLILTRSALYTARGHGLLDLLRRNFALVAPRSLEWELREEVDKATGAVLTGHKTMMGAPTGFAMFELEPNDPTLVATRDEAGETLAWVMRDVQRLPRPLESMTSVVDEEINLGRRAIREEIGAASLDAAALAEHGYGTLYADDLGIRRFAVSGVTVPTSISTVTLLDGLVTRGLLSESERGRIHADLVLAGYVHIPPSDQLLLEALHRMPGLGMSSFRTLFDTLGGPLMTMPAGAGMVATVLRKTVEQAIERATLEQVTEACVLALAKRTPRATAAAVVRLLGRRELHLLPHHLARLERVCDRLGIEEPPPLA
jgi:tetratricopeptide (TPR) repeat protein